MCIRDRVRSSRTQAQLDKMVASTVSLINNVEAATERKDFPTKTSMLCDWCEYKSQCPEFSHQFASKSDIPTLDTSTMTASQAAETVDKLVELKDKKKSMSADMDAMIATLEAKLIVYSKESGHKAVFGKDYKVNFKDSEGIKIPDKKDLRRYELESTLKEMNLWGDLQEMSAYRLKSKLKSGDWSSEQKAAILKYMDTDSSTRVGLKKL